MIALTLWPEWAWAIAWLDKRVENRVWQAPRKYWGERIAIHAGAHVGGRKGKVATEEGLEALMDTAFALDWFVERTPTEYGDGSVGLYAEKLYLKKGETKTVVHRPVVLSAIVATAKLVRCRQGGADGWGDPHSFQWVLDDVRTLDKPIGGVRGERGLWPLPEHLTAQVQEAAAA